MNEAYSFYGSIPILSDYTGMNFSSQRVAKVKNSAGQRMQQEQLESDLARNKLRGEIPRLLYWNGVLQYLGLRRNMLTGILSPDICQLSGLWYFDVRDNQLTV